MNKKSLLILTLGLVVSFMLLIIAGFAIYRFFPTALGLPPNPKDAPKISKKDTLYIESAIYITKAKLDKLQQNIYEKDLYKVQRDQIFKNSQILIDSIGKLQRDIAKWRDSTAKAVGKANLIGQSTGKAYDSLSRLNVSYKKALADIELYKKQKEELEKLFGKKSDSLMQSNFISFAKIYDKAAPAEVAKVLEQIEEKDAATILKTMNKKKSAKILEAMKPDKSAAILLLGGGTKTEK